MSIHPPDSSAQPRRLLPREERQAQLLDAAAAAFARAGFAATSMETVAAEAGVTRLIVYRHFDSKEELYRSVLQQVRDELTAAFLRGLNDDDERPGFAARAHLTVARRRPDAYRLLWQHAAREPAFAAYAEEFRVAAIAAADVLLGSFLDDPVRRSWGSALVLDYLVDATLSWLDHGDPARDDEFVTLTAAGLVALVDAWR